jgi:hypothetical protein
MNRIDVVPDTEDKKRRYWGRTQCASQGTLPLGHQYRKQVRQQTRDTYRRLRQAMGTPVRNDDCADNIPLLDQIGEVRNVRYEEDVRKPMLTLTVEELAKALEPQSAVLYRWFAADMFPRPTAMAETEHNRNQPVGLHQAAEAEAAMREFSRHQKESQYYRERHVETRDRIYAAHIQRVRADLAAKGVVV